MSCYQRSQYDYHEIELHGHSINRIATRHLSEYYRIMRTAYIVRIYRCHRCTHSGLVAA